MVQEHYHIQHKTILLPVEHSLRLMHNSNSTVEVILVVAVVLDISILLVIIGMSNELLQLRGLSLFLQVSKDTTTNNNDKAEEEPVIWHQRYLLVMIIDSTMAIAGAVGARIINEITVARMTHGIVVVVEHRRHPHLLPKTVDSTMVTINNHNREGTNNHNKEDIATISILLTRDIAMAPVVDMVEVVHRTHLAITEARLQMLDTLLPMEVSRSQEPSHLRLIVPSRPTERMFLRLLFRSCCPLQLQLMPRLLNRMIRGDS